MDSEAPLLMIMRELHLRGWTRGDAPAVHTLDSPKFYGSKAFIHRKAYMQCLLGLDILVDSGLERLSSKQPIAYYKLLLKSTRPASVPLNKKALEYEELGQDCNIVIDIRGELPAAPHEGDEESDAPMGEGGPPCHALMNIGPQVDGAGNALMDRVDGSDSAEQASEDEAESSASSSGSSEVLGDQRLPRRPITSLPNIAIEEHLEPGQRGYYIRLRIMCPFRNCKHSGSWECRRNRNFGHWQTRHFGQREPEAFLGAWAEAAPRFRSRRAHIKWSPSTNDVKAFMQRQGWLGQR